MLSRSGKGKTSEPAKPVEANGRLREEQLGEARAAFGRGDWADSRAICLKLLESDPASPGNILEQLASSEFMIGSFDRVVIAGERAYRAYVDEGDKLAAIRVATRLVGLRELLGDWQAARGWDRRGWRLLEDVGPCIERGYHALGSVGCNVHDPRVLSDRAEIALGVAREFNDHQLELRALADQGLALICQGRVDEGFSLLDEVVVAVAAGELTDRPQLVNAICALLSACERTGDRGRAEYWGQLIDTDPRLQIGATTAHCQIAYGVVDSLRGRWEGAETRLLNAMGSERSGMYQKALSTAKMAELRIQQGRYAEAEEYLRGYEDEFDVAPVLAALYTINGDYEAAAGLLRTYTRGLGSDCMRLAPALSLLVDLELKREDVPAATRAARRLLSLEDECSSNEIRAMARLAAARIAAHRGDSDQAVHELETALTLLIHRDRPLLLALIRLELARVLASSGHRRPPTWRQRLRCRFSRNLGRLLTARPPRSSSSICEARPALPRRATTPSSPAPSGPLRRSSLDANPRLPGSWRKALPTVRLRRACSSRCGRWSRTWTVSSANWTSTPEVSWPPGSRAEVLAKVK